MLLKCGPEESRFFNQPFFVGEFSGAILRYCFSVWGNARMTVIEKLQKLHNRVAKVVTNSPFDATALLLFVRFNGPLLGNLLILSLRKWF